MVLEWGGARQREEGPFWDLGGTVILILHRTGRTGLGQDLRGLRTWGSGILAEAGCSLFSLHFTPMASLKSLSFPPSLS